MAFDPVLVADTKGWLQKAMNDLRGAEVDLAASPPLLEDALFHCQQAAEKSFKAFLTYHQRPFRKTHNLEELGEVCLMVDPTLRGLVDEAAPLTEYAWAYRYPGSPEPPLPDEAQAALVLARRIYQAVLDRTPVEIRP